MTSLRQRMLEDLQIRHYSPTTIRLYLSSVAEFARHFHKPPDQLGPEHIRQYQLFLIKEKHACQSTCVQLVCALRFVYTHTLHRKVEIQRIPFPRRERTLPLILSRDEVEALLEAPRKLRDRAVCWPSCMAAGSAFRRRPSLGRVTSTPAPTECALGAPGQRPQGPADSAAAQATGPPPRLLAHRASG